MTAFHAAQCALLAASALVAALRMYELGFRGNLHAEAFLERLLAFWLVDGRQAGRLAGAAGSAWVARLASAEIGERRGDLHPGAAREVFEDLRREAARGMLALLTIGRAAPPFAFVGVMVEMGLAFRGDHGLLALKRGLVEQIAMQNAVVGVTLGLTTSIVSLTALQLVRATARQRMRECALVEDLFERANAPE